jgi:hypothetical protein
VNTATDLEERLEIRADLIYSGILPTVEKLKQLCFDELGKDFAVSSLFPPLSMADMFCSGGL